MVKAGRGIYVCRVCHRVGQRPLTCHPGASAKCDAGVPGDVLSMPLFDTHGHLVTRAPKWWVDACFKLKARNQESKARTRKRQVKS